MAKQYIDTDSSGSKFYYKDPEMTILHREDGPAYIAYDGKKTWFANGKIHRVDGPAVEYAGGAKRWVVNGMHLFHSTKDGNIISRMDD